MRFALASCNSFAVRTYRFLRGSMSRLWRTPSGYGGESGLQDVAECRWNQDSQRKTHPGKLVYNLVLTNIKNFFIVTPFRWSKYDGAARKSRNLYLIVLAPAVLFLHSWFPDIVHRVNLARFLVYVSGVGNNFSDCTIYGHQAQARYTHLCRGQRINPHKGRPACAPHWLLISLHILARFSNSGARKRPAILYH